MRTSQFNLTIALLVYTTKTVADISTVMEIDPTEARTASIGYSGFNNESSCNLWILHKRYHKVTDIDTFIQRFFDQVPNFTDKIQLINQYCKCVLRLSIVSIYGQLGFSLSQEDIMLLRQVDIPVEISFLSYGNCKDE